MYRKTKKLFAICLIFTVLLTTVTFQGVVSASTLLEGNDRYATALRIVQAGWTQSENVIIARGDDLADALAAAPLAYAKEKAPILLTKPGELKAEVLNELKALGVKNVYIVGGTGAISTAVEKDLKDFKVTRISGNDRVDTSYKIALEAFKVEPEEVVIANGLAYSDALSISSIAARKGMPILLVVKNKLTADQAKYIEGKTVYAIGGTGVLSEEVVKTAKATRISGADRYETNAAILTNFEQDYNSIYIAKGTNDNLVDALAGSALAAKDNNPIVLVGRNSEINAKLSDAIRNNINDNSEEILLGGQVSQSAADAIEVIKTQISIYKTTDNLKVKIILSKTKVKPLDTIKFQIESNDTLPDLTNSDNNVILIKSRVDETQEISLHPIYNESTGKYEVEYIVPLDMLKDEWYVEKIMLKHNEQIRTYNNSSNITFKVDSIVSFNSNGGSNIENMSVGRDEKVATPLNPVRTSYIFGGWYSDNTTFENKFDFENTTITEDITLFAKWIVAPPVPTTSLKAESSSYNSIVLNWGAVKEASGYEVYRSTSAAGANLVKYTTTETSFKNSGLVSNYIYYYKIRAYKTYDKVKVYSVFSPIIIAKAIPARPITKYVYNNLVKSNGLYAKYAGLKVEILDQSSSKYLIKKSDSSKMWVDYKSVSVPSNSATNKEYLNKNQLETYVNTTSTFVSKTKYFTWVDTDRQRVNIFTGSAGHWVLLKAYSCASGNNVTPSKRGLFAVQEKGGSFVAGPGVICKYWTRYSGNYLLHSILLRTSGAVYDGTLGKKASHGCIRMPVDMAKFFYDKVPRDSLIWVN
ncbi:cell wall-binding repeat-containing protein [Clostridium sp.]|uniref:cell wall-binding repeat-containing protein n=1 Tax=Clostridium sp. TaxID=1506 RepID=UPI003D6CCA41